MRFGRPLVLLMDADIALAPGTLVALRRKLRADGLGLVSLMAAPGIESLWERLLMPAFVYFFKLLYPFRLANSGHRWVAAAAGGCILVQARLLEEIGGFEAIRGAIIDDCSLARRARAAGYRTWIGLTHSARMLRHYGLGDIWEMISRTAYTQLRYSLPLLVLCSGLLLLAFVVPVAGLAFPGPRSAPMSVLTCLIMARTYLPVLRYYGVPAPWAPGPPRRRHPLSRNDLDVGSAILARTAFPMEGPDLLREPSGNGSPMSGFDGTSPGPGQRRWAPKALRVFAQPGSEHLFNSEETFR